MPVDVFIYQTETPYLIVFLHGLFSVVATSTIKLATGYISCLLYIFSSYNFKYISKSVFVLGCECVVGLHSWPYVITHRHNDLTVLLKLPLRQYSLFQQQPQWKVHNYPFHTLSLEFWDIFFFSYGRFLALDTCSASGTQCQQWQKWKYRVISGHWGYVGLLYCGAIGRLLHSSPFASIILHW